MAPTSSRDGTASTNCSNTKTEIGHTKKGEKILLVLERRAILIRKVNF
jgi:hypothetical protein